MSTPLIPGFESAGLLATAAAVAALGFKHGFDADHLAAIDAIGRLHRQAGRSRAARWSGAQFSLGHGLAAALAALLAWQAGGALLPDWLDAAGAWVSIICLTLVGVLSIRGTDDDAGRGPAWRRALIGRLLPPAMPAWAGFALGGLFAVSLDTLAMATWFGAAGARLGGLGAVVALVAAFVAGMLLADGVSGWWVNRLAGAGALQRARGRRLVGWVVGLGALATAALGALRQAAPGLDGWADAHALPLGLSLLAATSLVLVAAAFMRPRAS
jgi:high-affinity nickel-transport protein